MKYDNQRAFEKHLANSAPDHFSNLYLIMSSDDFLLKATVNHLKKTLTQGKEELAFRHFEAHQVDRHIILELDSQSLFSQKQMIWIQSADKLKKEFLEALQQYFTHPQKDIYLLLTASSFAKNSTFYKTFEKHGVVCEIAEEKPWEKEKRLADWINQEIMGKRKLIPFPACQSLVKQSGADQAILAQELEKLFCYVGERQEITMKDIAAICVNSSIETMWQLGESIFRREAATALKIARSLIEMGNALLSFLRQLRFQVQTGFQVCCVLSNGGSSSDVAKEFPYMKGQILEKNIQIARHYGIEHYRKALLAIDATEFAAKNSQADELLLTELLIIKLVT